MRKLAIGLWFTQIVLAIITPLAAGLEIESILVTGPMILIVGIVLASLTRRIGSINLLLYALSGPIACGLCAMLIAVNRWQPDKAHYPITFILAISAVIHIALAFTAWAPLRNAPTNLLKWESANWQYSLKSMLAATTAVCIILAVGRVMIQVGPYNDFQLFSCFTFVCIALVAFTTYRFFTRH